MDELQCHNGLGSIGMVVVAMLNRWTDDGNRNACSPDQQQCNRSDQRARKSLLRTFLIWSLISAGLNSASSAANARQEKSESDVFVNETIRTVEEFDGCTDGGFPDPAFAAIKAIGVKALPALIENITSNDAAAGPLKQIDGTVSIIANCLIYRIAHAYLDYARIREIEDRHYRMGRFGKNVVILGVIPPMTLRRKFQREFARQLTEKNIVDCEFGRAVNCFAVR